MPLLDSALRRPASLELSAQSRIPSFYPRGNRLCCYGKLTGDGDEQKHETTRKGFSIRVPTIPNLGDIESARRMLESAFHALSFEMPKIPVESALQGLIFKLSIPKRVLVFDITGFAATKLKKPPKDAEDAATLNEGVYPRCAWPRNLKEAHVQEVFSIGTLENLQDTENGVNLLLEEHRRSTGLRSRQLLPRTDLSDEVELGGRLSWSDEASYTAPVGPHCAWPRKTHPLVNSNEVLSAQNIPSDVQYPCDASPRKGLSGNGVDLRGQQSFVESNGASVAGKQKVSPCVIEGGARCAWPRKTVPAKLSCSAEIVTSSSEDHLDDGSQTAKDAGNGEITSAGFDVAAELPRRMLATGVGLSIVNQIVMGSIVTSLFDFCSLLPAGPLEIAEEEDAAVDLGRRTLLVFVKQSAG